jgi:formylglycine-generating enzyme required for sulfatase activity
MRGHFPGVAWMLSAAAACSQGTAELPPEGQVILYVDTDAPLPDAGPGAPPALFDRLRITLLPPGSSAPCDGCTQEFELTTPLLGTRNASVGLTLPPGQSGWLAHLQMFPLAFAATTGDPDPDTTVDLTVALPTLDPTGLVEVTAMLSTATVGQPVGSAASPVQPTPGPPGASLVGSWGPAKRVTCQAMATQGDVCVPGGAFWMGTTRSPNPPLPTLAYLHPRLVTLSPFFLGAAEVTVAEYRSFGRTKAGWTGSVVGINPDDWCTFTSTPGSNDTHPLNCVYWSEARAYCRSTGGDLPTEAQWEYAAGGLAGTMFVWGSDLPGCGDAVWGRAGFEYFASFDHVCTEARPGEAPVPLSAGGRALDKLVLAGGTIYDLAGNLAEWTLDAWDSPDGACWGKGRVYSDPVCGDVANATYRSVRGGAWYQAANSMPATERLEVSTSNFLVANGFRCARPDPP